MVDGGHGRDGKDHISNSSGDHSFQVKMMFVRRVLMHSIVQVKTASCLQVKGDIEALIKTRDLLHDEV